MRRFTVVLGLMISCACGSGSTAPPDPTTTAPGSSSTTVVPEPTSTSKSETSTLASTTTTTVSPYARPDWLGIRLLPLRDDGFGENLPTPDELQGRAFETLDLLETPAGEVFESTTSQIPENVLARSTWSEDCPVALGQLRYLTMTHWGFDGKVHTGEMIVNEEVADSVVGVFSQLFDARFPIEQMRVIAIEELDAPPTGDFNDTTSFVCRPVVNSTGAWSQHAYGLAVDINPFHNPYEKGDLVLPELASYYLDRTLDEPGMIVKGDVVTEAFSALGWGWGGEWNSLDDYMHFSRNGH